jgi:hypothetical protein
MWSRPKKETVWVNESEGNRKRGVYRDTWNLPIWCIFMQRWPGWNVTLSFSSLSYSRSSKSYVLPRSGGSSLDYYHPQRQQWVMHPACCPSPLWCFIQMFLDDLCELPFPASLLSLSIEWTAGSWINVDSKHATTKNILLLRFPSLRRLSLCDWTRSALMWVRTASGQEKLRVIHKGVNSSRTWTSARGECNSLLLL